MNMCKDCAFWTETGKEDSGIDWNGHVSRDPAKNWHYAVGNCSFTDKENVPAWSGCWEFKRKRKG